MKVSDNTIGIVSHLSFLDILHHSNETISSISHAFQSGENVVTSDGNHAQSKSNIQILELEKIIRLEKEAICPNGECGKMFKRALVLTDLSKKPIEMYHACPHCLCKVKIVAKTECQHYFGYLKRLPKNASIPDDCLTCPRITQCLFNYHLG